MFQVDAIGFWEDEPDTVMVTMDVPTLAQLVRLVGKMSPVTGLTDELSEFYDDATSKIFNRLYEDGVNDVG